MVGVFAFLILGLFVATSQLGVNPDLFLPGLLMILIFFFVSLGAGWYMTKNLSGPRPQSFVTAFMATTTFRLLIYLGTLIGFLAGFRTIMVELTVVFFVLYVLSTVLEKALLINNLRKESN